jgi:hypothetical protein
MSTCLNARLLWDDVNAERFGNLCRRTLRLCEEGQSCPLIPSDGRILLVSSERGLPLRHPAPSAPIKKAGRLVRRG